MKMSKYENSLFPYSLQITVNLPEWKLKGKCYFNIFSPSVYWNKKALFQNYMKNIVKIDKIREELWRNHQNRNFFS